MSAPTASLAATDEKPPVELVNVQVDGVWMKFPKGMRMIRALEEAGKVVPHYCYHPKLSSPGNCRMCLVEMGMPGRPAPGQTEVEKDEQGFAKIQWIPRPAISCANTVSEGMGIRTHSKMVEEVRKGVMEFLLINHPLDCPICDQAGECRLQEFSVGFGRGESRFQDEKVHKPKNQDIGARIVLDDERCIMCSRCVRFSSEIADEDVLGFTERGSQTVLTTHPGQRLDHNYSLNTVDICPVGALTSKDFRFQMRVWFLKETESLCTGCGRGCNTEIGSREGIIYRQTPRQNDEVNSTWMCDHGRLDFHWANSERRLLDPMVRDSGAHRVTTWPQAVAAAAAKLSGLRGDQIAVIGSGRMTNEELFMLGKLAAALKSEWVDIVPRSGPADNYLVSADRNPNTAGAKLIFAGQPGAALGTIRQKVATGEIKAVIAWRENLLKSAGFTPEELGRLDFLLCAHVMANRTADLAHVVLPTAAWAEKRGSMINATGRLQRLNKAIEPPANARDDWEALRDLTQALAGSNGLYLVEDVFKALAAEVPEFAGLNLGKIGSGGRPLLAPTESIPLLTREADRKAKGIIVG
ncbi:MAG: molybdopterin-dependent oxidoreductase [Verrucomicrobiales bacterium]